MALLRPRLKQLYRSEIALSLPASVGEVDLFDITGGPGIIKQGGFSVSGLTPALADMSLLITIDATDTFDFALDNADNVTTDALNPSFIVTSAAGIFDLTLDNNANWGFLTSVQFTLRNDAGAADTFVLRGGFDYHVGA